MKQILDSLGLEALNPGTWLGADSTKNSGGSIIESVNPATGDVIGSVRSTTPDEYEKVIAAARASFADWRKIPAPLRGNAIRLIGNALRDHREALGSLVTLETGKIKAEGSG